MYFWTKTEEEIKAIVAKRIATRRANSEAKKKMIAEARARVIGLKDEIDELERKIDRLNTHKILSINSAKLTGKSLLTESEIVNGATEWNMICGIYFLIKENNVVYIGQSQDIFHRISAHFKDKIFDSIAYISCDPDLLDKMESLYIHALRPKLNGNIDKERKLAPLSLDKLLSFGHIGKPRRRRIAKESSCVRLDADKEKAARG